MGTYRLLLCTNFPNKCMGVFEIRYKFPSAICESKTSGGKLAFLHIFGSSDYGPYLWMDTANDPLACTVPRIKKALELFIEQIGVPTTVLFNSIVWDLKPLRTDILFETFENMHLQNVSFDIWSEECRSALLPEFVASFERNVTERVAEIIKLLPDTVDVGFRTVRFCFAIA
jgi:hypothetical protein